jgi:hypothetical protein
MKDQGQVKGLAECVGAHRCPFEHHLAEATHQRSAFHHSAGQQNSGRQISSLDHLKGTAAKLFHPPRQRLANR